jgi:hypothetical protein
MHHTWIRSHVKICLIDIQQSSHILADDDGDFPFRFKSAACYIRVEKDPPHLVRIFSVAASGVPRSSKLLTELNDLNNSSRTALAYWTNHTVFVEHTLHPAAVNPASLAHSCQSVGIVAADIGELVAAVYGGRTPFNAIAEIVDEDEE